MSSIKHQSTQADAEYAAINHEFGVEHRLYLQCKHDLAAAQKEIERLRTALGDIINPIGAMQRNLEDGYQLNGAMAVAMVNDPEHYKRIARAALTPNVEHQGPRSGPLHGPVGPLAKE